MGLRPSLVFCAKVSMKKLNGYTNSVRQSTRKQRKSRLVLETMADFKILPTELSLFQEFKVPSDPILGLWLRYSFLAPR